MTDICTRPGCEIQHDGRGYCPTCAFELKQQCLPQLECGCLPGACHGGHTITRLSAVQSWMLAHDWTELSEGDSGWMWQHTTGRKVAVFRDLTDPHMWEGLIGRLAVAHARHPGDIEREIRGGEEPVRLADEQLRRITQYVHPDDATAYVRPWLHSMAGELLAARARVAELEIERGHLHTDRMKADQRTIDAEARVAELEAEQRESSLASEHLHLELQRARLEAAGPKITSETSDGYHTFTELYHYRMLYNAAAFNAWAAAGLYDVHKSIRHSDGEFCFGGDWFVVYATLPKGQISNHYEMTDWGRFQIPERETAVEWDGHTPQEAAERLAALLDSPVAERKPIGYACRLHHSGMRELTRSGSRENAEAEAAQWRSTGYEATVVELHEPRPVTE